ncbi:hypothetical protein [Rugamonas sp. DEMB1]|uniref:hypothetical protein n=1 Tax=Rugamonas sp. DEMB1 TaxID=3039386 RepID=UPI00244B2ECC|nr:hypothetical protein [Rugamonas sp. DEMB1]WGG50175.1 hypothetical protein QC826_27670 [Rugamonas sp. DEMB1]
MSKQGGDKDTRCGATVGGKFVTPPHNFLVEMLNITLQSISIVLAKNCPTLKLAATIDDVLAGIYGAVARQGGGDPNKNISGVA